MKSVKIKYRNLVINKIFLKNFVKLNKTEKIKVLNRLSKKERFIIYEIIKNILCGNIKINKRQLVVLKKFKTILRLLCNKNLPEKNKNKYFNQKGGGFLPALVYVLPAIISKIIDIIE